MELIRQMENAEMSENTLDDLIGLYAGDLYKFCLRLTYSKEDAEDLFQETFLRFLERQEKPEWRQNGRALLFSTALYLWKSWKRRFARRSKIAPSGPLTPDIPAENTVETGYLHKEEIRIVRELVDSLPDKLRVPVILHYTSEMGTREIARTLGLPEGTVKSRLFKARLLIGDGLEAMADDT